jgi:homoserine kinase type II
MAVYTEVSFSEAAAFVTSLGLGELQSLQGIQGGIENTNYFADTTQGRYVLTLFERLSFEQLPFYLNLMRHLANRGVPVPEPKADAAGNILHIVQGKPAALVDRLPGAHHLIPNEAHCTSMGAVLATMHLAGADFAQAQPNLRGLPWWNEVAQLVSPHLSPEQNELLQTELLFQQQLAISADYEALPRGAIHGDLFRDNVLFIASEPSGNANSLDIVSGLFDFYFASIHHYLFDIAVCLNDWCTQLESGQLHESHATAFVTAYTQVRPLTDAERRLLPGFLRAAALRFWLSRLWDLHLPRNAALLTAHDPSRFERVLRLHRNVAQPWLA